MRYYGVLQNKLSKSHLYFSLLMFDTFLKLLIIFNGIFYENYKFGIII